MGKLNGKPNRLKFSIDGKFRSIEMFDRLKKFDRWKNSIEIFDRLKNSIDFLNRFALFRLDFSSDSLPKKRVIQDCIRVAGPSTTRSQTLVFA